MRSKKKLITLFGPIIVLCAVGILHFKPASAAFTANNIIDDSVFNNTGSMSASQIDSWLNNNFPSSCISTNKGFSSADPIGYNPTQGFIYGGPVSAGKVIYDAAQAYGLNPQVLLATLEKEENLVTGASGCSTQRYTSAVGYSCTDVQYSFNYTYTNGTDPGTLPTPLYYINGNPVKSVTGSCVTDFSGHPGPWNAGFSEQMIWAAWFFEKGFQRSEGNVNWMVIKPNWDNSDESDCYSGPMTQGNLKRCRSDTSTVYYDGYVVIDGQSVHMDNGATASLYWFTPHFHGNQIFYNLFSGWFGSTHYPEPVGGILYAQSSTGKIYLVTTDNNTRYYIPSWSLLQNYRLDRYQIVQTDDATINSYTDGGNLTNLVWDDSGVYLVNNAIKYHFPGPTNCTDWGYDCSDSSIVMQLGSNFQNSYLSQGTNLGWLAQYGTTFYKMSDGQRLPIANSKTLNDLGATPQAALTLTTYNNQEPLGNLVISTSTPIKFRGNSTIYYFEGGLSSPRYHPVSDANMLKDWNISSTFTPPASSYDVTPPASDPTALNQWYTDGTNKYLIDNGRKYLLNGAQQQLWPAASYQTYWSQLAASLPNASIQKYISDGRSIYAIDSQKHHIPTYDDYVSLGINTESISTLEPYNVSIIATGDDALGDGKIIGVGDGLYVINNHQTLHVPDASTFNIFRFRWDKIYPYDSSILTGYPSSGELQKFKTADGGYSYILSQWRLTLSAQMAINFGLKTGQFTSITSNVSKNLVGGIPVSKFIYDVDSGKIYYASGGALHYVQNYSSYVGYGGPQTPSTVVNSDFISNFLIGQPI